MQLMCVSFPIIYSTGLEVKLCPKMLFMYIKVPLFKYT